MGSQNWGSQNPKQSLTSRFWEGPMILTANKNSEDSKKTPTFWVCISKLPWFHCWLVQVLLKHYQFLGFFFPPTSNQISPPPKKKLSVGPRRRGIAMWEILRCKKWPGPREFSSLWEQPIMWHHDFLFYFLLGDFFGVQDLWWFFFGDFVFLGVIFVFNQGCQNLNGWLLFFGIQECQNGFCMRRQWCPAENANWASTEAKKMWKLWCVCESWRWQSSSKIKSWIRTLSMWRQLVETHYLDFEKVELWFKSYVHYHKPLPQSLPTIGILAWEKIHLFPLGKRWGLAWMSQRLMKRNPFHIHRGHGFSREIFESQGFRVISDLIRLP